MHLHKITCTPKNESKIYDYVEDDLGLTISMYRKRLQTYRAMKYLLVNE